MGRHGATGRVRALARREPRSTNIRYTGGGIARRGGSDELSFGPFIHLHRPPLMSTVLQVVAEDEREEPAVADDSDDFLWARA